MTTESHAAAVLPHEAGRSALESAQELMGFGIAAFRASPLRQFCRMAKTSGKSRL